jgi:hypothetical protein
MAIEDLALTIARACHPLPSGSQVTVPIMMTQLDSRCYFFPHWLESWHPTFFCHSKLDSREALSPFFPKVELNWEQVHFKTHCMKHTQSCSYLDTKAIF